MLDQMKLESERVDQPIDSEGVETNFEVLSSRIIETDKKLDQKLEEVKRFSEEVKKSLERIERDKVSFITVSGIFLSIFTFISVEVRFLETICQFSKIIGFSFLFAGILFSFIFLLDWTARTWTDFEERRLKELFVVGIIAAGLILLGFSFSRIGSLTDGWKCDRNTEIYNGASL